MASTTPDRYQRSRRTPHLRPRRRGQLEPFAISTERYEDMIREAHALPFISPERAGRIRCYAERIGSRTGESTDRVLARLA